MGIKSSIIYSGCEHDPNQKSCGFCWQCRITELEDELKMFSLTPVGEIFQRNKKLEAQLSDRDMLYEAGIKAAREQLIDTTNMEAPSPKCLYGRIAELEAQLEAAEKWQKVNLRTISRLEETIGNVAGFLKDGETIEACIARNRKDLSNSIGQVAEVMKLLEAAELNRSKDDG